MFVLIWKSLFMRIFMFWLLLIRWILIFILKKSIIFWKIVLLIIIGCLFLFLIRWILIILKIVYMMWFLLIRLIWRVLLLLMFVIMRYCKRLMRIWIVFCKVCLLVLFLILWWWIFGCCCIIWGRLWVRFLWMICWGIYLGGFVLGSKIWKLMFIYYY